MQSAQSNRVSSARYRDDFLIPSSSLANKDGIVNPQQSRQKPTLHNKLSFSPQTRDERAWRFFCGNRSGPCFNANWCVCVWGGGGEWSVPQILTCPKMLATAPQVQSLGITGGGGPIPKIWNRSEIALYSMTCPKML